MVIYTYYAMHLIYLYTYTYNVMTDNIIAYMNIHNNLIVN